MNLPTKITVARIAVLPLILLFYCLKPIFEFYYVLVAVTFFLAATTDFIDGYIARKYNMVTDLGKFLDPIADKILVVSGLLIIIGAEIINIYVAVIGSVIILSREFIIGVFRQIAASKGSVLAADRLGKIKTMATLCAITWLLISPMKSLYSLEGMVNKVFGMIGYIMFYAGYAAYIVAVIMTVVSGANYIIKNKHVLRQTDDSGAVTDGASTTIVEESVNKEDIQ